MKWKNFLFDWRKFLILILLLSLGFLLVKISFNTREWTPSGRTGFVRGAPIPFYGCSFIIRECKISYLNFVLDIIILYLISCFLVWIYDKLRRKKTTTFETIESIQEIKTSTIWWYIFNGLIGGVIGYRKFKAKDKRIAKKILVGGIITSIITLIVVVFVAFKMGVWDFSVISNPIRKFIYKDRYTTFSDGITMDYPASWYKESYGLKQGYLIPFDLYPNQTSNLEKKREMKVSVEDNTHILSKKGINNASSATEFWLEELKGLVDFEIISKDLNENVSVAKLKYVSKGKINYFNYKIIKCNEKIFELHINAEEPNNLDYSIEIEKLMSSFRCK